MFNDSLKRFSLFVLLFFTLGTASLAAQAAEQFLSLADLHFDPFLSCHPISISCPLIQALEAAPATQWAAILSRDDHSLAAYGKDSNYSLLASSLSAAKKEGEARKIRFVLVLGDLLAHDYREKYFDYAHDQTQAGYVRFVEKTLAFLSGEFLRAFPRTEVYQVVGNNDSFGGDYSVLPEGAFFKDFSRQTAELIHNPGNRARFLRDFPRGGYFAVDAPSQPALRLIFLNSVLFSKKARGQHLEAAAQAQLEWLHQELQQAQQRT